MVCTVDQNSHVINFLLKYKRALITIFSFFFISSEWYLKFEYITTDDLCFDFLNRYVGICAGIKILALALFLIDWWLVRRRRQMEEQATVTVGDLVGSIISLDKCKFICIFRILTAFLLLLLMFLLTFCGFSKALLQQLQKSIHSKVLIDRSCKTSWDICFYGFIVFFYLFIYFLKPLLKVCKSILKQSVYYQNYFTTQNLHLLGHSSKEKFCIVK